jgi:hypothetical protein
MYLRYGKGMNEIEAFIYILSLHFVGPYDEDLVIVRGQIHHLHRQCMYWNTQILVHDGVSWALVLFIAAGLPMT